MKLLLISFLMIFSSLKVCAQQKSAVIDHFDKWAVNNNQEKVYLHTDKPYYFKGDTIWFKGYVVTGAKHQLSGISGALYTELIGANGIITALKLPIVNGMAKGCFVLNDSLKQGDYNIRAYTQWMCNEGESSFYNKKISINDPFQKDININIISSRFISDNENETILHYRNTEGNPLVNKKVNYQIISDKSEIKTAEGTTDNLGNLKLTFKYPNKSETRYVEVSSTLNTSNGSLTGRVSVGMAREATNIQFLPEGGTLVEGIRSRIGVKSVGPDGLGRDVTGQIVDQDGQVITEFKTEHLGMGKFSFTPEVGKSYKAIVIQNEEKISLPAVLKSKPEGAGLACYDNQDTLLLRVMASPSLYTKSPKFQLIAVAGAQIVFQTDVVINKPINSVKVLRSLLPAGVVQITLFSELNLPVAERLIFNESKTQMELQLNSSKPTYATREKVVLDLQASSQKKPLIGSFSVSVVDESTVPIVEDVEHSILTDLLLCSDLKGYIEKPSYYFNHTDEQRKENLDLLMLTQGYRSFVWKEVLTDNKPLPAFLPERLTTTFKGSVKSFLGKPMAKAKVVMLSLNARLFEQTVADENGHFEFPPFVLTDSVKISFKASGSDGKRADIKMDILPTNYKVVKKDTMVYYEHANFASIQKGKLVKEKQFEVNSKSAINLEDVKIVASKKQAFESDNFNGAGNADFVVKGDQLHNCANLRLCIEMTIPGISFGMVETDFGPINAPFLPGNISSGKYMMLYINGFKIDVEDYANYLEMNDISPEDVTSIELLKSLNYTNMYNANARGVLVISTRKGWFPRSRDVPGYVMISPKGFSNVKDFYVPKYDVPQSKKLTDYRNTIYWNPSIATKDDGKTTFSYFNGDAKGVYRVTIEGITADGLLGRQVYRYKVE